MSTHVAVAVGSDRGQTSVRPPRSLLRATFVLLVLAGAARCEAQAVSNRGFADVSIAAFPQDAPIDPVNTITDVLVRDELFLKPTTWLRFAAGADVRLNTHDQVERSWRVDIRDRRRLRPGVSVRRLSGTIARGPVTVDIGKQFIRWGKTDIVTPTDRFAPRDFLNVIETEFLAVSGARTVLQLGTHTVDVVWVPVFTPSRIPLFDQRWFPTPVNAPPVALDDRGADIPDGSQAGVRYSRIAGRVEFSVSAFNGFNHLPNIEAAPGVQPGRVDLIRRYPTMRSLGGDAAVPTRWFTVKAEAAYSTSDTAGTDDYLLYVIQLERQTGEWQLVGGYAGEAVTSRRAATTFAPDRGLTRAIVARAAYTIDPNRSLAFEGAVRQNGRGAYTRVEYSQARGQHWRATLAAIVLAGASTDFLGQFNRNSHIAAGLRYSF